MLPGATDKDRGGASGFDSSSKGCHVPSWFILMSTVFWGARRIMSSIHLSLIRSAGLKILLQTPHLHRPTDGFRFMPMKLWISKHCRCVQRFPRPGTPISSRDKGHFRLKFVCVTTRSGSVSSWKLLSARWYPSSMLGDGLAAISSITSSSVRSLAIWSTSAYLSSGSSDVCRSSAFRPDRHMSVMSVGALKPFHLLSKLLYLRCLVIACWVFTKSFVPLGHM
mmetsp:Transcript_12799/g.47294  ORF Transcript_12799/g.47294 Transcript_12799/m.47294 type:complete len:223 (+) Transcript_12799:715-1383(+)